MHSERRRRLVEQLQVNHVPAILITNDINRAYLTGFTGSSGYVLVTENEAVLLTDFRYTEQASAEVDAYDVIEHGANLKQQIRELLNQWNIKTLALEDDLIYREAQAYEEALAGIELVFTSRIVEKLRLIKDEQEINIMKEACALADRAYEHILAYLKPGVVEQDIALELEVFMRKHGAASSSFDMIVASGERSAMPHGVASDRKMQLGDFVTMDFGAHYKGYCSDITRTVVLGPASDQQREIYHIVLEAQMLALEKIRPGMSGKEADAIARDVIHGYGYGDQFGHSTGHGLGMEIHEEPRLSIRSETVLEPGMIVTVEPGIYLPGLGGVRIEDDVVITESGVQRLTLSNKELIEV